MEFIDAAPLGMGACSALACFPRLPTTANELLLVQPDQISTRELEDDSSLVVGEGDSIVHSIAGDQILQQ